MASTVNLSRNTKVYLTTNVNQTTGAITDAATGFTTSNTFEIQVLDGYSFSQGTEQKAITINEAGGTPLRGQRAFNTQLNAVDWSLSTYIRPRLATSVVTAVENVLWNALLGAGALDTTGTAITSLIRATTATSVASVVVASPITATVNGVTAALAAGDVLNINGVTQASYNQPASITAVAGAGPTTYTVEFAKAPKTTDGTTATVTSAKAYVGQWAQSGTAAGSYSYTSSMGANRNQLQRFGLIFVVDSVVYGVDNCVVDQASIDFGLDAISMIAWTGKGAKLNQLATVTGSYLSSNSLAAVTTANYITNKLSTMTLQSNAGGDQSTGYKAYTIAITGGNVTIANNTTYLIPSNLGVVNTAINYFTGQRVITGNVTAYLKTGTTATSGGGTSGDAGSLLSDLLTGASSTTEPKYRVQLEMGGAANAVKVELEMPAAVLQIPAVNVADVVSTTINFSAQGFVPDINATTAAADLARSNELLVRYFSN